VEEEERNTTSRISPWESGRRRDVRRSAVGSWGGDGIGGAVAGHAGWWEISDLGHIVPALYHAVPVLALWA